MRPHLLRLSAFGAFAGVVEVDFDALAGGGVFLLHGETGAGKSTLLDAIGFALYGQVPGERGTARRLRSDHAAAVARTEVCLEATVGGRRIRVRRSPDQVRAKKRGSGTTTEPAKVLLERFEDGCWTALSTRVGEADQEIADLMGMSADQFFQVILLPQGEFARFLRAPSEERRVLLERLFEAGRFGRAEDWLAARRREVNQALEGHRDEIAVQTALIAQIAEIEPSDGVPDRLWASDLACQHQAGAANAGRILAVAAAAAQAAGEAAEAARTLAARQQRRRQAEVCSAELAAAAPEVEALVAELQGAAAAVSLDPLLAGCAQAAAAVAAAAATVAAADAAVVACGGGVSDSLVALRATAGAAQRRHGSLLELHDLLDSALVDEAAGSQATACAAAERDRAANAAEQIRAVASCRADHLTQRDAAVSAAAALPQADRRAALLAEAATTHARLGDANSAATRLRADHVDARERWQDLVDAHHQVRRARFDSMVAELAARLVEGTPCPVCGSVDHPDTPQLQADRVGVEQEETAAAAAEVARQRAERVGLESAGATATADAARLRLAELLEQLGDGPGGVDRLAETGRSAAQDRDELAARAALLPQLEADLAELDEALAAATTGRVTAEQAASAHGREAETSLARAAADRAKLVAQLGGAPDLASALRAADAVSEACSAAADARAELARARAEADRATRLATAAAVAAGFPDLAGAAAATRDPVWRAAVEAGIRDHRAATAGAAALLADPELDIATEPPVDVDGATAAAARAADEHDRAVAELAHARRRATELDRKVPVLSKLLETLPVLERRATTVRGLADLTAGQGANSRRMTLSAFVLAARLEEIAAVAGQRLLRMTGGRYSLVHTDVGRGTRRSGLGMLARDNWTGVDRDTATLSGGETFLASLALALALADVVCAESGGTRLESLFVDEGFGSLDESTLDEVMDVLDGLREGGRVVGIVSHVAELRQRITTRVHVHKHETGSTVETVA
ncbi:MAG TPA: AAA family ATPase [Sporichthyaceae bacterium]|nr:AAA family ATPase [Sporichthyaceae bacterium]